MIKRFLALSDVQRARIVIWLYDRYVVQPALEELWADCLQTIEFEAEFEIDGKKQSIH